MSVQPRFETLDPALAERLYREAKAERWRLPQAAFTAALETSCAKAFPGAEPAPRDLSRYLTSLHLEDLALACACALGDAAAWDHFVLEMRPGPLPRRRRARSDRAPRASWPTRSMPTSTESISAAARASRCCATFMAAAVSPRGCGPCSHSAMSIACGSSAVTEPLPEELPARGAPATRRSGLRALCRHLAGRRSRRAMAQLAPRDRLRLGCYYAQQLTLAETGRLLKEHEATTSRQLARTRKGYSRGCREDLRDRGLNDVRLRDVSSARTEDVGATNLDEMLERTVRLKPDDDPQESRDGSFNMKREPMADEPRTERLARQHAAAIAGRGRRCLSRRRDAGGLGRWRPERAGRGRSRAARVELLALHGGARGDGAHGSARRGRSRLDAGAPVPLARAVDGCRHGDRHLGCVPDRPITPQQTAAVQDLGTTSERADSASQVPVPVPVPVPERRTQNQNPAPSTQNAEPLSARRSRFLRRKRCVTTCGASAVRRSRWMQRRARRRSRKPHLPRHPLPPRLRRRPVRPHRQIRSPKPPQPPSDRLSVRQRPWSESVAPSNPLVRWRVVRPASIERSTDGGKTWTSATPLPGVASDTPAGLSVVAVRAVDAERAVVRTSDGRELLHDQRRPLLDARARKFQGSVLRTVGQSPCTAASGAATRKGAVHVCSPKSVVRPSWAVSRAGSGGRLVLGHAQPGRRIREGRGRAGFDHARRSSRSQRHRLQLRYRARPRRAQRSTCRAERST